MAEQRGFASLAAGWVGVSLCLAACLAGCQGLTITWPNGEPMYGPAPRPGPQPGPTFNQAGYGQNGQSAIQQAGYGSYGPSVLGPAGPIIQGPAGPVLQGPVGPGPMYAQGPPPGPPPSGDPCETGAIPTELNPRPLPTYMVEPPDILLIDTLRMIPRPPYVVQPLDVLILRVAEPAPGQPVDGTYTVSPDGTINLGFSYGLVRVAGLTLEQVEEAVRRQVGRVIKEPQVAVGLAQFRGIQQVRGEHLVRPDGTISLGSYGCVYVAGLTLEQIKRVIQTYLSQYVLDPEISVDVFAYNSKVYYVITDGAGYGMQVNRFPVTGKETVLDAIGNIGGLPAVASKKNIWVARPTPAKHGCVEILPVDWLAITQAGATGTNYQLYPGDRVYVGSNPLIKFDNILAQIVAPIERLFGVTLLGVNTIRSFSNNNGTNGTGTTTFFTTGR